MQTNADNSSQFQISWTAESPAPPHHPLLPNPWSELIKQIIPHLMTAAKSLTDCWSISPPVSFHLLWKFFFFPSGNLCTFAALKDDSHSEEIYINNDGERNREREKKKIHISTDICISTTYREIEQAGTCPSVRAAQTACSFSALQKKTKKQKTKNKKTASHRLSK